MLRFSKATPIIVVSMHRSGSSFTSALLRAGGLHMGSRLMPAGQDNPLGFFENLDFVEFHERWLGLNGHDTAGWIAPQSLNLPEEAYAEAAHIVKRNDVMGVWGWKDPRTTIFADFWSDIVPNAKFIFLYREPAEVVDSLLRRRDPPMVADPELAVRSWISHNATILRLSRTYRARRILANVSVITREPHRFLSMVTERFGAALNADVTSPFNADLMRRIDSSSEKATLLRYLAPECERVYLDLELEADLAGGVHRDGPVSPRRARGAFFCGWLDANKTPITKPADSSTTVPGKTISHFDTNASLESVREALSRHEAALLKFTSRIK